MSADSRIEMRFARGDAGAADIQEVVDEVLAELSDPDSEASRAAKAAGLEPAVAASAAVEVTEGGHGLDPVLTPILIGIAVSAGSKAADSLWNDVLWPRLRRRLGVKAVGAAQDRAE